MKAGDFVRVPRFGTVRIETVFNSELDAWKAGYTETCHYWDNPNFGIYGKVLDRYHMVFAAFRK